VPEPGVYRERLNTDSQHYGGSNVGTPYGEVSAQAIAWNGRAHCIEFALPPLATVIFEWKAP
jgi:1,4-alpha-glucan branching enzyme